MSARFYNLVYFSLYIDYFLDLKYKRYLCIYYYKKITCIYREMIDFVMQYSFILNIIFIVPLFFYCFNLIKIEI